MNNENKSQSITDLEITEVVDSALNEINSMRADPVENHDTVVLLGSLSKLDSLDFVTLLTTIEDLFRSKYSIHLSLINDRAFAQGQSPYRTIGELKKYLREQINESID